ncbi:MAG: hypothetical protein LUG44_10720, partial [Clostridiales bacterium]|nr:hypothetical protein [Clostridiales bacterium]
GEPVSFSWVLLASMTAVFSSLRIMVCSTFHKIPAPLSDGQVKHWNTQRISQNQAAGGVAWPKIRKGPHSIPA